MQPTYFINHGGGPCFFIEGAMREEWRDLERYLQQFATTLADRPSSIPIVSGHWEEDRPTVNSGVAPQLLFDYTGFPEHTYRLTWPAPGSPALAAAVRALLADAGISSAADDTRGWDHGVFVPLKVMFPQADIPVVQLSLQLGLEPHAHLAIGQALRPLRERGALIIGSGQSYHNMQGFMRAAGRTDPQAEAFDSALRAAMVTPTSREDALVHWARMPGARAAQPHEDHLLPLMVAAGAASGDPGRFDFHGHAFGKPISGFRFG